MPSVHAYLYLLKDAKRECTYTFQRRLYSQAITKLVNNLLKQGSRLVILYIAFKK